MLIMSEPFDDPDCQIQIDEASASGSVPWDLQVTLLAICCLKDTEQWTQQAAIFTVTIIIKKNSLPFSFLPQTPAALSNQRFGGGGGKCLEEKGWNNLLGESHLSLTP